MSPSIRINTTPEYDSLRSQGFKTNLDVYRVEIDGREVGPVLTIFGANTIVAWLEAAWPDLVPQ